MARIRTVKPEMWQDEDLSQLPPEVHLLAVALLNHADDEGYFRAHPKLVEAQCCPLREDSLSVHGMLTELSRVGYIWLGTGEDGKRYGWIKNFAKHQRVNRPQPSKIAEQSITWDSFSEDSVNTHGTITEPSPPEGNREQGTGKGREVHPVTHSPTQKPTQKRNSYPEDFERIWAQYPKRSGDNPKKPAHQAYNARLREGHTAEEMEAGLQRYAAFCDSTDKTGTETVMQGKRFFGPDKPFKNAWEIPHKRKTVAERADALTQRAREKGLLDG